MKTRSRTPGICRIDQPAKHNHGYFVRLQRRGKTYSAFFTDIKYGGRRKALAAAQKHYRRLLAKVRVAKWTASSRWTAIRKSMGSCSIVGVHKLVLWRQGKVWKHWAATWSPEPYVIRRKTFSVRKYGLREAKRLAIRARRAGLPPSPRLWRTRRRTGERE
jgi:hypothetical protein